MNWPDDHICSLITQSSLEWYGSTSAESLYDASERLLEKLGGLGSMYTRISMERGLSLANLHSSSVKG